ncbi:extracellular catalytic domain type 1 short-chain-length polyhydroxyalkanoate depolymerase [Litorisediminicola beolgyonensis]|uniref:Alpha/beta hydrolase family esterase n=1 Tax=Litorisediminicola beolgyonensis TaxID=1173614 RepID=A0ABW3ZM05_9RHOB
MNDSFATAMGRALDLTRAGSTLEATRLIQDTLSGAHAGSGQPAPRPKARTRQSFGQVIDALASARRAGAPKDRVSSLKPSVPVGARYEARTHASPHGTRDYRLFVPSARAEAPQGLVVMLHGCTQTADDFAVGTRMNLVAEENNLIVIYPDQARQANQMGCWNWFRPEDQARGAGEPALLAGLALQVSEEFGVARGAIFAAGLSAGGAMAAILGATYPEVFSAIGVHSGLAAGAARDLPSALAAMRGQGAAAPGRRGDPVRAIVFHGSADTTVAPANADAVIAGALGMGPHSEIEDRSTTGATVTLFRDAGGAVVAEKWSLGGIAHAWSGGAAEGSHTDPNGPEASVEMVRFFLTAGTEVRS